MLKPRLAVVRPLSICLWLGSIAALGVFGGFLGCQGPDTFLRNGGGGGNKGSGGTSFGSGGTSFGSGGTSFGSGGSGMGGRVGTGGSGTGGRAGSGGSATGGTTGGGGMTGTGGARDAGADVTGAGGAIVDANSDSEAGVVIVDGPCMGLCAPAVTYSQPPNFGSPQFLASQSACYQTLSAVHGGGCSNCGGRINSINGVSVPVSGWPATLPAPVRGGYCIQVSVGQPDGGAVDYASFYTF